METKDDISVIFSTGLGWLGVTWGDDVVRRLVFGHARKQDAAVALRASRTDLELTRCQAELVSRLKRFADGDPVDFSDVSLELSQRTRFQQSILRHCRKIKWGTTSSYAELARAAGRPGAARAVGTTMARNPIPIIIPCHRIVPSGGGIVGGFSAPGGNLLKQKMLTQEGIGGISIR